VKIQILIWIAVMILKLHTTILKMTKVLQKTQKKKSKR
jgi:hypothetical protein